MSPAGTLRAGRFTRLARKPSTTDIPPWTSWPSTSVGIGPSAAKAGIDAIGVRRRSMSSYSAATCCTSRRRSSSTAACHGSVFWLR